MIKSKFIGDILTLLLGGDEQGAAVKGQLDYLIEGQSNYTGSGVFTSFEHISGIENFKAKKGDLVLNGVTIKSPKLKIGAEATLFFKDGLIEYLELWSFDGAYPKCKLSQYELQQEYNQ